MNRNCRAAVIVAHNEPLVIREIPIPELEPGALLVRIAVSTLCGTDVHRWHGPLPKGDTLPIIIGHEPCGYVEAIKGERTDILGNPVTIGDRIIWSYVACGSCYYCSVALQRCICPHRVSWGHQRCDQYPYLLGSCAEYMYVPPSCLIIKVPPDVPSTLAAASACAFRTIMHGFEKLGPVYAHEIVLIQGSGPLGIFATAVAREHGAKCILVIGAPQSRLEVAKRMGADDVLDLTVVTAENDRRQWVLENTEGRGADIVIQVANNMAVPEGLNMLRRGGRYVHIGAGGQATIPVENLPQEMVLYTIRSGEPRHWLQAIDFLASRKNNYPFEEIISASYTLDRVNEALNAMASFQIVKPAIVFE